MKSSTKWVWKWIIRGWTCMKVPKHHIEQVQLYFRVILWTWEEITSGLKMYLWLLWGFGLTPPPCLSIFLCSLYFSRPSHHLICLSFSPPPLLHLSRPTVSHLSFPSLLQRWYLFRPAGQKEEVPEQEKEPDHRLVSAERLPLQEVQTGEFTHTPEVTQKGPCELRTHQEKID